MRQFFLILAALLLVAGSLSINTYFVQNSWAQTSPTKNTEEDGFGEDEEDGGFKEIKVETPVPISDAEKGSSFGGFIREDLAYGYQKPDSDFKFTRTEAELNKIRLTLNLYFDFNLSETWKAKISGNAFYDAYYSDKGRNDFPNETLRAYEQEFDLRDTFVEGPITDAIRIKIGRQIIAWGESEGTAIVDMANPRDNRELGLVDIEDARIPIFASKLSYLAGAWEWNLVALHEFLPNKNPTEKSDFDFNIRLREVVPIESEKLPDEETEWLFRLFKSFKGGDISLIYADVFEDDPYLDFEKTSYIPRFQRIKTYGASGNIVKGFWLFKFELAKKLGAALGRKDLVEQRQNGQQNPDSWSEKDLTQWMLGFDYTGVTDLSTTFEVSVNKIEDYEDNLASLEWRAVSSLTLRYDTWNDTLHPQFLWVRFSNNNGDLFRISADYDYIDAWQLSAGITVYDASKKDDFLFPYRRNDRIFGGVKYSF